MSEYFALRFPLAERALERLSRSTSLYLWRFAGLAGIFYFLLFWGATGGAVVQRAGTRIALVTVGIQILSLFVVVLVRTPGAIARERAERTLELLLLADFRGADVVISRFVVITLELLTLLVLPVPLLAAASFLGGISVPNAVLQFLVLAATGVAMVAAGLAVSAWFANQARAAMLIIILTAGWWVGGGTLDRMGYLPFLVSPALAVWDPAVEKVVNIAILAAAITAIGLAAAVWGLLRETRSRKLVRRPRPAIAERNDGHVVRRMLDASSGSGSSGVSARAATIVMVGLIWLIAAIPVFGSFAFLFLIFYSLASRMAWWHKPEEIDLLTMSPMDPRLLVNGTLRYHLRANTAYLPCFVVFGPYYWIVSYNWMLGSQSVLLEQLPYLLFLAPLGVLNYLGVVIFGTGAAFHEKSPVVRAIHNVILFCVTIAGIAVVAFLVLTSASAIGVFRELETWNNIIWPGVVFSGYLVTNGVLFHVGLDALCRGVEAKLCRDGPGAG